MVHYLVPWMSGLVNGLQNRLRRFESARHLWNDRNLRKEIPVFCYYTILIVDAHNKRAV